MTPRTKLLKQLVEDELYVIDATAVADAVLLRATARYLLPEATFRSRPAPAPEVRSFRPHRGAKSFRLTRVECRPSRRRNGSLVAVG